MQSSMFGPYFCKSTCLLLGQSSRSTGNRVTLLTKCQIKKIAVIGAGPAGLSAACVAAERGHEVHLYDSSESIGGQFKIAMQIPGKEEFAETLRYFKHRLDATRVHLHLNIPPQLIF